MTYFVKFVPYNQNTLTSLINRTIKFSNVFEFNDFNELHYMGGIGSITVSQDYIKGELFKKIDKDYSFRNNLICNAHLSGIYTRSYLDGFGKRLNFFNPTNDELEETDYRVIEELLTFSSVGIFCVSHINVFCDDSAQLMFAHYADNLKGLALIYEIDTPRLKGIEYGEFIEGLVCLSCRCNFQNNLSEYKICSECKNKIESLQKDMINYKCEAKVKPLSAGLADRIKDWLVGNFNDMQDFLNKSDKWRYEKEYRIFDTPGIKRAENTRVELKAILHSSRFDQQNLKTLNNINKEIYGDCLIIQEITPSLNEYQFVVQEECGFINVKKWLEKLP